MSTNFAAELVATANAIGAPGKGIGAFDESTGTIGQRFAPIGVENTEENRLAYREMLVTTPGLGQHVSGCILYEETLFQSCSDGVTIPDKLKEQGIITGIKVDMGVQPLFGTDGETVTQGITGLAARCKKYYAAGARFAKWRAVLCVKGGGIACPSQLSIDQNAATLARYAAICQSEGLVPIVEPEVLMDGDHSLEISAVVSEKVYAAVYKAMSDHHVLLEGSLLKPNMVRPGTENKAPCTPQDIARATVRVLQHTVPVAVPGITFLSGGMSEEQATLALNAINNEGDPKKKPWALTFSYGRALQSSVLKVWMGKAENNKAAQDMLMVRAKANGEAALGTYKGDAAVGDAGASLHVKNYSY